MIDEEPVTAIDVLGELGTVKSSRDSRSAPRGCGVDDISMGVDLSTEGVCEEAIEATARQTGMFNQTKRTVF
jgi:hypothetical protein